MTKWGCEPRRSTDLPQPQSSAPLMPPFPSEREALVLCDLNTWLQVLIKETLEDKHAFHRNLADGMKSDHSGDSFFSDFIEALTHYHG